MTAAPLRVERAQILAFRRRVGALDDRLPPGPESLRAAAFAGLQDSMPRAALLSIHARVSGTSTSVLDDPSLAQVWGPRYSVFVIPADDRAPFTLGLYPDSPKAAGRAEDLARRLAGALGDRKPTYDAAGQELGVPPNALRYAAATGTVLIRWEGARAPLIWTVPRPAVEPPEARRELARRYLRVYGPASPAAFSSWSGLSPAGALAAFDALQGSLTPVSTPIGEAWILNEDEALLATRASTDGPARLLPSGDPYLLYQGRGRELLVPDPARRAELWTPRVWPGGILLHGELVGTWRRAGAVVTAETWTALSGVEKAAVESEAASLPLPGLTGAVQVRWSR